MYYVWRSNTSLSNDYMFVSQKPSGLRPAKWKTGKPLSKQPSMMTLIGDDDSPTTLSDIILTSFNIPVLSEKAVSILDEVGVNNIQYYPIEIKNWQTGEVEKSYKIGNVIGTVDCLNRKGSNYTTFPENDDISWLQEYSIFEEKISPAPKGKDKQLVFRLGEFTYHILVHENVKTAFDNEGITGSEFIAPEVYA